MGIASIELREKKKGKSNKGKSNYDPVRSQFEKEYKDFDNIQLLKEHLFQLKTQGNYIKKSSKDIAVIKLIVVISFAVSIVMGIIFGFVL